MWQETGIKMNENQNASVRLQVLNLMSVNFINFSDLEAW
jgi:hypothetical protein